jgi:hypothetical protein
VLWASKALTDSELSKHIKDRFPTQETISWVNPAPLQSVQSVGGLAAAAGKHSTLDWLVRKHAVVVACAPQIWHAHVLVQQPAQDQAL